MISAARRSGAHVDADDLASLGLLIGFIMPIVSAICFNTYTHEMHPHWVEWTRLMEIPFVLSEILVTHVAIRRGYRDVEIWRHLPIDIRVALGLLLVGVTVSSVCWSKDPASSIALSIVTFIHLRFAAATYFLVRRSNHADPMQLMRLLGAGLAALALLTAWKFAFPPPLQAVPGASIEWGSALPGFISVRHFGSWTGAIAAGLMLAVLFDDGRPSRITAALYFLAVGMTIWSGTRAAILALAIVALVTVVSLRRLPSRAAVGRVIWLTAAALVAAWLLLPPGQTDFQLFVVGDYANAGNASAGRLEIWQQTFSRWLASPLFGWGSGSTFWEVYVGWSHTQPHNAILQFLISWGLVGAAGALWLIGRAIGATHRAGMADPRLRPLAGVLYSLLFMSLLEGMLHYPRFIMMIAVGFAVILAKREEAASSPLA